MAAHGKYIKVLNNLNIPAIKEPFEAEILWFQEQALPRDSASVSRKMHHHTFIEVHFPVEGMARYRLPNGEAVEVYAGEYICFSPGTEHMFLEYEKGYVKFSLAFLCTDSSLSFPEGVSQGQQTKEMQAAFSLAIGAVKQKNALRPYLLQAALLPVIVELAEYHGEKQEYSKCDLRVFKAKRYVEDNRRCALNCGDVAAFMHFSKRQLDRIFMENEGITVEKYIRRIRCETIKAELIGTQLSLREVAEQLSFSNEYNLIRFFKKEEGMTPGEFRKARQG